MNTPNQGGWFDDPEDPNAQRYWDGENWAPYRQRKPATPPARPPQSPVAPPPRSFQPPPVPSAPPPPPSHAFPPPVGSPLPPSGQTALPASTLPPPMSPPPQASPPGPYAAGAGGGPLSPENLAAIKVALTNKPSGTGVLLYIGLIVTAISVFLAWETITVSTDLLGTQMDLASAARGTSTGFRFVILAAIVVAAWLAWPVLARTSMSMNHLLGLSAIVGLMVLSVPLFFLAFVDNDPESGTTSSYDFGLYLYTAAVIAVAVGAVRVWIDRSRSAKHVH